MSDRAGETQSDRAEATMLDHALGYLERGLPIFPICSPLLGSHRHWDGQKMATCPDSRRGKLPLVKWKPYQTALPSELDVRSWWARWPRANIGMATGSLSGVIVLDCDSGDAKRQAMGHGGLSETPATFTGRPGGVHFHLQHPGHPVSNFAGKQPGLDFRGDGGYVLLPPSRHASGATYRWVTGTETLTPAALPPWLAELLESPGEGGSHEPLNLTEILNGTPDGKRDVVIYRFACKMRGDNVERQYAEMIVTQAAIACKPPFPVELALEKVARAWRTYQPNPTFTVGEGARAEAEAAPVEARTLADVLATFRRWLHFENDCPVLTLLATIAANRLPGDPLWVMFVGASSSGKTELIMSARHLDHVHLTAELTAPALLSATPRRDVGRGATGGLLRQIGQAGIVIAKDFTTVLSMKHDARAVVLAALREIFDGSWTRHVGVDGGRTLHWEGKLGLITGCTTAIDTHHAVMAAMGERFIFCRLPETNRPRQARRALRNRGQEQQMRAELADAVAGFFTGLDVLTSSDAVTDLTDEESDRLIALADFAARARSGVDRDRASREIDLVHDVEAPARLVQALSRLYAGLLAIGMERTPAWELVRTVGMDCLPKLRRAVLEVLISSKAQAVTTEIATAIGHPTVTTRRVLEDMNAHHVLDRIDPGEGKAHVWTFTDEIKGLLDALG